MSVIRLNHALIFLSGFKSSVYVLVPRTDQQSVCTVCNVFFSDRFCLAWHTFSIKGLVLILERNNGLIMIDDSPKMLRRSRSQREIAAGSWKATFWIFLAEGAWCSYIRYFTVFACFASTSMGHFLLLYRAPFMLKSLPQLQPWQQKTLATAFSAR